MHELGTEWHLMSATAVMAMGPALLVTTREHAQRVKDAFKS